MYLVVQGEVECFINLSKSELKIKTISVIQIFNFKNNFKRMDKLLGNLNFLLIGADNQMLEVLPLRIFMK